MTAGIYYVVIARCARGEESGGQSPPISSADGRSSDFYCCVHARSDYPCNLRESISPEIPARDRGVEARV